MPSVLRREGHLSYKYFNLPLDIAEPIKQSCSVRFMPNFRDLICKPYNFEKGSDAMTISKLVLSQVLLKLASYIAIYTMWNFFKHGVFSGLYFLVLGMSIGKYRAEKTPYLNIFHAVLIKQIVTNIICSKTIRYKTFFVIQILIEFHRKSSLKLGTAFTHT